MELERRRAVVEPHLHPGARVAAVVHEVVDQPGVPPRRVRSARGAEVRLGGDRVLPVAQLVADVGEQLDQRDAEVGRVALPPVGHAAPPAGRA